MPLGTGQGICGNPGHCVSKHFLLTDLWDTRNQLYDLGLVLYISLVLYFNMHVLNDIVDILKVVLNYCILYTKYYIYIQKLFQNNSLNKDVYAS